MIELKESTAERVKELSTRLDAAVTNLAHIRQIEASSALPPHKIVESLEDVPMTNADEKAPADVSMEVDEAEREDGKVNDEVEY